jgi:hypothetical protein
MAGTITIRTGPFDEPSGGGGGDPFADYPDQPPMQGSVIGTGTGDDPWASFPDSPLTQAQFGNGADPFAAFPDTPRGFPTSPLAGNAPWSVNDLPPVGVLLAASSSFGGAVPPQASGDPWASFPDQPQIQARQGNNGDLFAAFPDAPPRSTVFQSWPETTSNPGAAIDFTPVSGGRNSWLGDALNAINPIGTAQAQNRRYLNLPEILDPLAPLRMELWNTARTTLRQLEPKNLQLESMTSGPNWVPSNQDIARLNAELESAVIRRITNFVMPGGKMIGEPGGGPDVREVTGGADAAQMAFDYLRVGGKEDTPRIYKGTRIRLPGDAGWVGFRDSRSGPTVDLNVPGIPYSRLHYK